jgi:release factor glutamine methyltransferase
MDQQDEGGALDLPISGAADLVLRLRAAGCVFAQDEARLLIAQAASPSELAAMVDRRVSGLPLEHVLGWAEFCGMRIRVEPGVFVPRRRTELLVQMAAGLCRDGAVVVDMCCGSGAVGAAVLARCPTAQVHASDVDPAAVRCARLNVLEPRGQVYEGDLFEALPVSLLGRVDVLVANAPYVPTRSIASMPSEARLHEPLRALDGGADGLGVQRRIAVEAARWLDPDGQLLIETSEQQALLTAAMMQENGLSTQVMRSAQLDATVVMGAR